MHALLLCENALEAVWLTCIKLGLILKKTLLHRLLHLLPLVKLCLPLAHLPHLPLLLLLQRALLLLFRPKKKKIEREHTNHKSNWSIAYHQLHLHLLPRIHLLRVHLLL
jgi:hypothetical protein